MRDVLKTEELVVPEGVTISVKARIITVTGPRGTLTKNAQHVNMDIKVVQQKKQHKVMLAVWQGGRKHVACLRTIKSLINNMVTGVTKVSIISTSIEQVESDKFLRASCTRCALYTRTFR